VEEEEVLRPAVMLLAQVEVVEVIERVQL